MTIVLVQLRGSQNSEDRSRRATRIRQSESSRNDNRNETRNLLSVNDFIKLLATEIPNHQEGKAFTKKLLSIIPPHL